MISEMSLYKRCWHPTVQTIKVGSWRRAYSIHEYFIEHSKGENCGEFKIQWKVITKLKELCKLVLAHQNFDDFEAMATKYLPNEFGEYGEYYKVYLQDTIRIIDRLGFPNNYDRLIYKEG